MNKSFIKFITDFGPLLVFLFFYYDGDKNLKTAIPPFIIATIISLAIVWFLEKKIPMIPLIGGILITLFGGLTIYFNNPIFIYIKPTIINIIFGLALLFSKFFTKESILKKILEKSVMLTNEGWNILNKRCVIFFLLMALLNETIWRNFSTDFWVSFKVFGFLPLTIIFTLLQQNLIKNYSIR